MALTQVDMSQHTFTPNCSMKGCDKPAVFVAKGCMDKTPVNMCEQCLERGIELIKHVVRMYQRLNKKVMICGDCHRPILRLDTHLEVRKLPSYDSPPVTTG